MNKKGMYQLYNLNKPFRLLILDKLQNGIKGLEFKPEDKETDLRHIEILKNWGKKSKIERMSFINDINLDPNNDEAGLLVLNRKEEIKQEFKDSLQRKKSMLKSVFVRPNK